MDLLLIHKNAETEKNKRGKKNYFIYECFCVVYMLRNRTEYIFTLCYVMVPATVLPKLQVVQDIKHTVCKHIVCEQWPTLNHETE